jgi:hypothetical protein
MLLSDCIDNVTIKEVKLTCGVWREVTIPNDKYYLEYYKGHNILIVIGDDNIETKTGLKIENIVKEKRVEPEYLKSVIEDLCYYNLKVKNDENEEISIISGISILDNKENMKMS